MEIASSARDAEALRDALLAVAERVRQLGGSPCAPGDTVPGDAQRLARRLAAEREARPKGSASLIVTKDGQRAQRYARSYAEEQAKLYDTFLDNLREGNNEMEE